MRLWVSPRLTARVIRGRFGIRAISGHKGVAERKTFVEQHLRVIICRPARASTTTAQSTVHRGVRNGSAGGRQRVVCFQQDRGRISVSGKVNLLGRHPASARLWLVTNFYTYPEPTPISLSRFII